MEKPLHVFCCYARADQSYLLELRKRLIPLRREGLISIHTDIDVSPGEEGESKILHYLNTAHIILLLVSPDFIASEYCYSKMVQALKRHDEKNALVIPIILRPVDLRWVPFSEIQSLPADATPVTKWKNLDDAFFDVTNGIEKAIEKLLAPSQFENPSIELNKPKSSTEPQKPPHGQSVTTWPSQNDAFTDIARPLRQILERQGSHVYANSSRASVVFAQQNRDRLCRRLQNAYQDVMRESLQNAARLEMNLMEKPDAVQSLVTLLVRAAHLPEHVWPAGTSIIEVYEKANQELLILGEPGSGKSTQLYILAQYLLEQAHLNQTRPLPIVFSLSSWTVKRLSLQKWMSEQLAQFYYVPKQLAQQWIQEGQILPLLDGLDEMEEAARPDCIQAINIYYRVCTHPPVVCSRSAEYGVASQHKRLLLQNAVVVQPLSTEQIETALMQGGESLLALRTAYRENPLLQELATTPLMLNLLILTYEGVSGDDLPTRNVDLQLQVLTRYVERMIARKGNIARYSYQQTCRWLCWLAIQMRMRQYTNFSPALLQSDWLPQRLHTFYRWSVGLCLGWPVALAFGLISYQFFGLINGLFGGLVGELAFGLIFGLYSKLGWKVLFVALLSAVFVGLLFGVFVALPFGPILRLEVGLEYGMLAGLDLLLARDLSRQYRTDELRTGHLLLQGQYIGILNFLKEGKVLLYEALLEKAPQSTFEEQEEIKEITGKLMWRLGDLKKIIEAAKQKRRDMEQGLEEAIQEPGNTEQGLEEALMKKAFEEVMQERGDLKRSLEEAMQERGDIEKILEELMQERGDLLKDFLEERKVPLIHRRIPLTEQLIFYAGIGLLNAILVGIIGRQFTGLPVWYYVGLPVLLLFAMIYILDAVVRHTLLRFYLWCSRIFPWHIIDFLEDAQARHLLLRVGDNYRFAHRTLLDYFANLNIDED